MPFDDRWVVAAVMAAAFVLFIWGKWRYDLVALAALLILAVADIVPAGEAFSGFSHPAVVTVAAVLVCSSALRNSGAVDLLTSMFTHVGKRRDVQVFVLASVTAVCSAFINNVGALAIMMPAAVQLARSQGRSPSYLLMPMAFGSLLGGMVTLIGTPPNIIIANFRAQESGTPFAIFDFAYTGAIIAVTCIVFIAIGGWRLVPARQGRASAEDLFEIDSYFAELIVPKDVKAAGMSIGDVGKLLSGETLIVGIARGENRIAMPSAWQTLREGDTVLVEGDAEAIKAMAESLGFQLAGEAKLREELLSAGEIRVAEVIVADGAYIQGRTAGQLDLRRRYGVNLLGVSRQGRRLKQRLRDVRFQAGDILLLQGDEKALPEAAGRLGCLPLAARDLKIGRPRRIVFALALFAGFLGISVAGVLPVQLALTACAASMAITRLITPREAYLAIDWSVIVLLAAMIPVGAAIETTGAAQAVADTLLNWSQGLAPIAVLALILIGAMFLSDIINNAAAAILMAPVAINVANGIGASADPFLMAVAIGASCAFLTPIGHQSNTIVLGPGGYRFGDYFRLGLPLEILIVALALPLLAYWWPLFPASP